MLYKNGAPLLFASEDILKYRITPVMSGYHTCMVSSISWKRESSVRKERVLVGTHFTLQPHHTI